MKRVLSLLIVTLMVVAVFAGCGGDKGGSSSLSSSSSSNITTVSKDDQTSTNVSVNMPSTTEQVFPLTAENIEQYKIVLPNFNISYLVVRKVNQLCDLIFEVTGKRLSVVRDDEVGGDYEIIIGDCNREGVSPVADYEKYEIRNNGKTLYVNGGRNYSVAYAVDRLIEDIRDNNKLDGKNESGTYDNTMDYRLVWTDEFNTLDLNTWTAVNEVQPHYGNFYGMGTARSTDPENFGVKDGKMYHAATYDAENFYGTYATTKNSVNFTYGYMEISSSLADGDGIWHAFWTWSDARDHLEFDIMECWSGAHYYVGYLHEFVDAQQVYINGKGNEDPHSYVMRDKVVEHNAFYTGGDKAPYWDKSVTMHEDMHTFSCEWTETDVSYFRDGERVFNYVYAGTENAYLYSKPHYFILSMLVGSNYRDYDDDEEPYGTKRPKLEGEYWDNGRNTWTIEYLQLFQKDGWYLKLGK